MIEPDLLAAARAAKGFMPDGEGLALHAAALAAAARHQGAPLLEVGTYCGKSAIYLGAAARAMNTIVYTVDHHRGSEENQAGWEHHDPSLVDPLTNRMDTLPAFRRTIEHAQLEDVVVAIVGDSPTVARHWSTPLAFVFIDGGHGSEPARADYEGWTKHLVAGGTLAIHDVFPDPKDGGRPPYELYRRAIDVDGFVEDEAASAGSLRVLSRARG